MFFHVLIATPAEVSPHRFPLHLDASADGLSPIHLPRPPGRFQALLRPIGGQNDKARFIVEAPAISSRWAKVVQWIRLEGRSQSFRCPITPTESHRYETRLRGKRRCKQ